MKFFKWCVKCVGAGIVAVIILSVILCAYSLTPVHEANPNANTDYVWPANSVWVKMTEGMAYGRFDNNGYNNMEVVEQPDVLLLGSSHMEATDVLQTENVGYLLGQKLSPDYSVYNLGISAHTLYKVCHYLPTNLELYKDSAKLAIIETSTLRMDKTWADRIINHKVKYTESHSDGIIAKMQKVPFLRMVYHQIQHGLLDLLFPKRQAASETVETTTEAVEIDEDAYDRFFAYLADLKEEYGVELLIFYHPEESLKEDGSIEFFDNQYEPYFSKYAEKYGIDYVNMEDTFARMYEEGHHVPHGFATGLLCDGHLNRFGHAAIADRLFEEIMKMKENGILCK